jgi:hypothetical protein
MARLQILELPEGASDERAPFLLVIDQADDKLTDEITRWPEDIAKRVGARHVLAFETTIGIPANEVPVDPDGYPITIRVEGDFEQFRQQVQDEATAASRTLAGARYAAEQYREQPPREDHGSGAVPLRWRLDYELAQRRDFITRLAAALGIEGDNLAIDLVEAARVLRTDRDTKQARIEAAAQLHRHVEHRGQTICGHCSAWDEPGGSTDNPPVLWPCDTVKALTGYVDEGEAGTASTAP